MPTTYEKSEIDQFLLEVDGELDALKENTGRQHYVVIGMDANC